MLKLASNLSLPLSAVSETAAFVGTRGSGKTYACGKEVEEMLDAGAQVVVVDPVGTWGRGLRFAADGRGPGIDVPVFGGWSGDIPLEPTAGKLVAGLVVERRLSVVLDVSEMTLGQQHRFMTDFATTIFHLKKQNRSPLHIVLEEAHEFLPQVVSGGEAEMVGAVKRLWKIGRNFGIGGSLVSQRPAEINKGALNLTERMFCGKLKGPQDRKAIEAWARDQDADDSVLGDLPTLKPGDLIHWTDKGPVRVRFLAKRTFDASRTPEADDEVARPLPPLELSEVREAMAATVAEAAANDPRVLRARIAELERAGASPPDWGLFERQREALLAAQARLDGLDGVTQREVRRLRDMEVQFNAVTAAVDAHRAMWPPRPPADAVATASHEAWKRGGPLTAGSPATPAASIVRRDPPAAAGGPAPAKMPVPCRRLLTALAQNPGGASRRKVAAICGYPPSGTSMTEALALARKGSWVESTPDGLLRATSGGLAALGAWTPLPTGDALRAHWLSKLPVPPQRVLAVLASFYPSAMNRADISASMEARGWRPYPPDGTSMNEALAALRNLELVDDAGSGAHRTIRASADLFDRTA